VLETFDKVASEQRACAGCKTNIALRSRATR
jgi:hypothetical protein